MNLSDKLMIKAFKIIYSSTSPSRVNHSVRVSYYLRVDEIAVRTAKLAMADVYLYAIEEN